MKFVLFSLAFAFLASTARAATDTRVCIGRFHERCFEVTTGSIKQTRSMGPGVVHKLDKKSEKDVVDAIAGFTKSAAKARGSIARMSMCETVVTVKSGKAIDAFCLDRLGKESNRRRDELIAKLDRR